MLFSPNLTLASVIIIPNTACITLLTLLFCQGMQLYYHNHNIIEKLVGVLSHTRYSVICGWGGGGGLVFLSPFSSLMSLHPCYLLMLPSRAIENCIISTTEVMITSLSRSSF